MAAAGGNVSEALPPTSRAQATAGANGGQRARSQASGGAVRASGRGQTGRKACPRKTILRSALDSKHKKDAAPRGTASEREDESKSRAFAALTAPRTKREQREVAGQTAARQVLHTRGRCAHRTEAQRHTKGISLFQAGRSAFPIRSLRSECKTYTPQLPPSLLT